MARSRSKQAKKKKTAARISPEAMHGCHLFQPAPPTTMSQNQKSILAEKPPCSRT
jgi:hypothetical protein